jgi:predicted Fe-S protein YdhL (DUF1289 family)
VELFRLTEIVSPCVGICQLEPETGLCSGCLRSAAEIGAWPAASTEQRLLILDRLKGRRRARGRTSEADRRPRRRQQRPQALDAE